MRLQPATPRVYTCFDATGSKNPAVTDLKYYFLLRAWEHRGPLARSFVDVHRTASRTPGNINLRVELMDRMRASDLLLLIITDRTARSAGWLSWELEFAARSCRLPIVCAYVHGTPEDRIRARLWPDVLRRLIRDDHTTTRHVPFQPRELAHAFGVAM